MRTTITISCLLLLGLAACSGSAQSLTEDGNRELGSGNYKAARDDFEKALDKLGTNTSDVNYLPAALGRCRALAHVDPKKAGTDFIALATANKGHVEENDFSMIAVELLLVGTNEARMEAIDVMVAGNTMFPESTKLKGIGDKVMQAAQAGNDPASVKRLNSLGYSGGGK
jgi:hypothetical protein